MKCEAALAWLSWLWDPVTGQARLLCQQCARTVPQQPQCPGNGGAKLIPILPMAGDFITSPPTEDSLVKDVNSWTTGGHRAPAGTVSGHCRQSNRVLLLATTRWCLIWHPADHPHLPPGESQESWSSKDKLYLTYFRCIKVSHPINT